MMKTDYIKMAFAVALGSVLFCATSCSDSSDDKGSSTLDPNQEIVDPNAPIPITLDAKLDVVDGAEDLPSEIYTTEKMVLYAWQAEATTPVVEAANYRYNGINWVAEEETTFPDKTSNYKLLSYVTGCSANLADLANISYEAGDGDLLYATATTTPQREAVKMDIKHAMAQLSIQFNFEDFRREEVVALSIPDVDRKAQINLLANPVGYVTSAPEEFAKDITINASTKTATVTSMMIPQSIESFNVNVYDANMEIAPEAPIELKAGERVVITVNVTKNPLVEVSMGQVSVEPWTDAEEVTFDEPIVVGGDE